MCHQSVGLVQGQIEKSGIPCISTTVRTEVTRYSLVSRAVYVRFPIGNPMGEAGKPEQQARILGAILDAFEAIDEPGTIVELPFRWRRM
jgi:D-proline reductase (dithiol) PrdB